MTEHAAVIFVFFFLAEYGSIVLICVLNTVLFLGGYLLDVTSFVSYLYSSIRVSIDLILDIVMYTFSGSSMYDTPFVSNYQIH
jgi:NADH-ubiquinone oxidoreductase chain 1